MTPFCHPVCSALIFWLYPDVSTDPTRIASSQSTALECFSLLAVVHLSSRAPRSQSHCWQQLLYQCHLSQLLVFTFWLLSVGSALSWKQYASGHITDYETESSTWAVWRECLMSALRNSDHNLDSRYLFIYQCWVLKSWNTATYVCLLLFFFSAKNVFLFPSFLCNIMLSELNPQTAWRQHIFHMHLFSISCFSIDFGRVDQTCINLAWHVLYLCLFFFNEALDSMQAYA